MGHIHILAPQIANMIAAGEVVERPASVVKELVENAIDAESTQIDIRIKQSGKEAIIVTDNGKGMDEEDALLAFTRHATSKITTKQDLFRIHTLGFRGEALPSIASVSKVTLTSSPGDKEGCTFQVIHNQLKGVTKSPSKKGTEVQVENLFYNTPARLKHLKSDTTELSHIIDIVQKLALGYPNIAFRLFHQDQLIFDTPGRGALLEVIARIYGNDFAKDLIPIAFQNQDFVVSGFIGKNYVSRPSRKYIHCLLNQRPIRLPLIYSILQSVYQSWIPSDRFPVAFLSIEADYQLVDINVHPSKNEVRLSKDDALSTLLKDGLKAALTQKASVPEITIQPTQTTSHWIQPAFDLSPTKEDTFTPPSSSQLEETSSSYIAPSASTLLQEMQAVGQIHGTYILAQTPHGFAIVDQHAAVERVQYEKLETHYASHIMVSALLVPYVMEFAHHEMVLIKEKLSLFESLGIQVEPFGHHALRFVALPTWITSAMIGDYLHSLVDEILQGRDSFEHLRHHSIATIACHRSLKANQHLTMEAMQALLDALLQCKNPHNCPHGRPTMIFYSTYELEKLFKRTGFK